MEAEMQKTPEPILSVHCDNIDEARVAVEAIREFRRTGVMNSSSSESSGDPQQELSQRIESALEKSPLNPSRQIVLQQLLEATPEVWVPYPHIQLAFENEDLGKEQAQAAIRDLSWQMKKFLPVDDVATFSRKIEVLAERSRSGGIFRYRLTDAGRAAVERFLPKAVAG
ncbi:MAG: hypothetical protein AAF334_03430 [Pseudomonadota bacterium]